MGRVLWRGIAALHRYLGIAAGVLMLMWFASGIVMIYVPYPLLSPAEKLRTLDSLPAKCCSGSAVRLAEGEPVASVQIEMLRGMPAARIRPDGRPPAFVTLADGLRVTMNPAAAISAVSNAAARIVPGRPRIVAQDEIGRDQWTVAEDYDFDRPLYRFTFDDPRQTEIYVSGRSGEVVLWTTGTQRFWNWLGAVPHWLYFTQLRRNGALWSKIVIWTSLAGAVLTLLGLYLGLTQFRRGRCMSPYRGWFWCHHLAGVVFGIFALTWAVSGAISMNPYGFLESGGGDERVRLAGEPLPWSVWRESMSRLQGNRAISGAVSLAGAPVEGKLFWIARWRDGTRLRIDADARTAAVEPAQLVDAAKVIAQGRPIESQGLLTAEDSYYYRRPGSDGLTLPVYRVVLADPDHTRFYIDPVTEQILGRLDSNGRAYRWLFDALHRLDFTPWLRIRPTWDVLILLLLSGGLVLTGSGCYLAMRRLVRDGSAAARFIKRAAGKPRPSATADFP